MTFKRRVGSTWADVATTVKRRSGTAWANVQTIKRRSGSAWVTVWEAYTTPTLSGSGSASRNIDAARPASVVTWTPGWAITGGGTFTYTWALVSGNANTPTISATNVLNPTFSATGPLLATKFVGTGTYTNTTATWRLTASDGRTTLTKDYVITIGLENTEMM